MSDTYTPSATEPKSVLALDSGGGFDTVLFVWDFDWTIVNCNSDEWIPAQFLGTQRTEDEFRRLIQEQRDEGRTVVDFDWHRCVKSIFNESVLGLNKSVSGGVDGEEKHFENSSEPSDEAGGVTPQDIVEAAAEMPYLVEIKEALDMIHKENKTSRTEKTKQMILSDGNTIFIGAFLKHNNLEDHFNYGGGVVTNTGQWETSSSTTVTDGNKNDESNHGCSRLHRLVVTHQSEQYGGHSCYLKCPQNLCKTLALQKTMEGHEQNGMSDQSPATRGWVPRTRIVYVGDGTNDACPAVNVLSENDVLLARVGTKRSNSITNQRRGPEMSETVSTGEDGGLETIVDKGSGSGFGIMGALEKAAEKVKSQAATVGAGATKKDDDDDDDHDVTNVPTCQVLKWSTGIELKQHIQKILSSSFHTR
mmetsp:Transcript_17488/g.42537  ORF Transcript_17488/g.42537 Transcript_17488/m.42537 type:complete len:419 (-) Transcript_17488:2390-3646(-)